jgi:MFS family permease
VHPPVPDPGAAENPRWPPGEPTGSSTNDAEQPTSQLPRRPDAGRFPYPAPQPPDPAHTPGQQPPYDQVPFDQQPTDPLERPRYPPAPQVPQSPPPDRPRYEQPARGSHLPPYSEPFAAPPVPTRKPVPPGSAGAAPAGPPAEPGAPTAPRTGPRKLTVTRVAAFRSRELTTRGVQIFQRAATADGADRSGLTALTYAVMGNYAVDAALAVALANTLFFAAATAESTSKVLLYLLITVAPFAVIAPLIGPALDKLQHGRRIALAASSFARALLAVVMALNFDSWVLYPCALGMLVLSKSFSVLKAAITPRVLPPELSLVKSNYRLSVFGLLAGGVAGALAAGLSWAFGSTGALFLTALLSVAGGLLCLRIPSWVESTAGEIPMDGVGPKNKRAFPLSVTTTLWANGSIRVETGFLALFIAFVIKSEYSESSGFTQLLLLGVVGVAAGLGGFIGNGLGARLPLNKPETVSILSLAAVAVTTLTAVLIPGLATAAIVGLVGSTASSLAKVCLDSVIQHELPEASRASAFGLSETVLQLSWVFGGVVGLLIGGVWSFGHDSVYTIGFAVITVVLLVGLTQSWLVRSGKSLFPWLDYSRLTKHFRRSSKAAPATGGMGTAGPRNAGQPPTTTWTGGAPTTGGPWQPGPATQGQAWSQAGAPPPYPAPPQYPAPPPGYPPAPYQSPYSPPTPPPHQPHHPPPRDAGKPRKEDKRP